MLSDEELQRLFGGLPDDDDEEEVTYDSLPDDDDEPSCEDDSYKKACWRLVEAGIGGYDAREYVKLDMPKDEVEVLADYVIDNSTRIIPLKTLREIAPKSFYSLEVMFDEKDIVHWPDDELRTTGLVLEDVVLARAFDKMYGIEIAW